MNRKRNVVQMNRMNRDSRPVHLLELSTDFGPGPDKEQTRCGADIFASVLALDMKLVTCPECKGGRSTK